MPIADLFGWIQDTVAEVDSIMGTRYIDRFQKCIEKEPKGEFTSGEHQFPPPERDASASTGQNTPPIKVIKKSPNKTVLSTKLDIKKLASGDVNGIAYEGVLLLSEENQALIIGTKTDGGLIYKADVPLVQIEGSIEVPTSFTHDPLDGQLLNGT